MTKPVISLLIPTMNNPWHLQETIASAFKGASQPIEALVFSNDHTSETDEAIASLKSGLLPVLLIGTSVTNEGVAVAVNTCSAAAAGDFYLYCGDDYWFLPGWDKALLSRVKPDAWQYLTPRCIERTGKNPSMYAPHDFGSGPADFQRKKLEEFWKTLPKQDVVSRWGPPFVARGLWDAIGGFDEAYYPGFGTDPDFAISLASAAKNAGQEATFIGVGDCGCYHFGPLTTPHLRSYGATRAANMRFLQKWGCLPEQFGQAIGDGRPLP